jgi:hypothetical protein
MHRRFAWYPGRISAAKYRQMQVRLHFEPHDEGRVDLGGALEKASIAKGRCIGGPEIQ